MGRVKSAQNFNQRRVPPLRVHPGAAPLVGSGAKPQRGLGRSPSGVWGGAPGKKWRIEGERDEISSEIQHKLKNKAEKGRQNNCSRHPLLLHLSLLLLLLLLLLFFGFARALRLCLQRRHLRLRQRESASNARVCALVGPPGGGLSLRTQKLLSDNPHTCCSYGRH